MNKANEYSCSNELQRTDAQYVLDEFGGLMQWRPEGRDSLLDVGCGCGDVTMDIVMPRLPLNFSKLVGVDISEPMVRFARETFKHSAIAFEILDISAQDLGKMERYEGYFDHVTSFYCLHWVQNQRRAIKNIYKLLRPGGDCLLTLLGHHPVFEIYEEMAASPKWRKYMSDVRQYVSPYHHSPTPAAEIADHLHRCDFSEIEVEVVDRVFTYQDEETIKKTVTSTNPFLNRMSKEDQEIFFADYIQYVYRKGLCENGKFPTPYKLLVAYARK